MFDQQTAYQQWLGLEPTANRDLTSRPNHYQLLGLQDFEPSIPVISKAAEEKLSKILAIKPESNRPLWQRIVNELAEAQSILTHPEHKAEYDNDLRKILQPTSEPVLANPQLGNHAGSEQFPASYSPSLTAMTPSQPNPQQYLPNVPQAVPVTYAPPAYPQTAPQYAQTAPQYSQSAPQYAQPYQQLPQAVPQYGQPVAPQPYGYDPYAQPGNYSQPQYAAPVYQAQPYAPPAAMPVAPPSYPQYGMPVAPPAAYDPNMNYGVPAYGAPNPMAPVAAPNPMAPVAVPQAAPNPMAPLPMQHSNTHGSFAGASQMTAVNSHAEATPIVSGRSYRRQQSNVGVVLAALIGVAFVAGLAVFMATNSQDDQSKQQAKNTNTNKVSKPAPATPVSTASVTSPAESVTPSASEPKVKPEPTTKPEVAQPLPMVKPVPPMSEMPVKPEVSMPAQPEPSMPAPMPVPMTPETKLAPQPMPSEPKPAEPKPMPETMAKPATPAPMPMPMPEPTPMPVKATPEQTKAFYAKLVEIRDLLGKVDFVTADKELIAAKKLAISEELDNDLASMELMRDYTKEFWRIIKGATKGLEGELQLKTTIVSVVTANEDKIVIRMAGNRSEYKITEMPLGLTAAIARKVFNDQPASKAAMGAYCFVTKGAPIEECDNLWNQANGGGVDCKSLQSLLKRPEFKR